MSKRLQVVMPDEEYQALERAARRRGQPIAKLVRESLRESLQAERPAEPEHRIAAVLRFARFTGPTGEIDSILEDIERGRNSG